MIGIAPKINPAKNTIKDKFKNALFISFALSLSLSLKQSITINGATNATKTDKIIDNKTMFLSSSFLNDGVIVSIMYASFLIPTITAYKIFLKKSKNINQLHSNMDKKFIKTLSVLYFNFFLYMIKFKTGN